MKKDRCGGCRYRSRERTGSGCDYAFMTGRTRTKQLTGEALTARPCALYMAGGRKSRQFRDSDRLYQARQRRRAKKDKKSGPPVTAMTDSPKKTNTSSL